MCTWRMRHLGTSVKLLVLTLVLLMTAGCPKPSTSVAMRVTTQGGDAAQGDELYEYSLGRWRHTAATGATVVRFDARLVQWWPDSGHFWYEQPLADYVLASYLERYELLSAGRSRPDASGPESWIDVVDFGLNLARLLIAGDPLAGVAAAFQARSMLDWGRWQVVKDSAREYLGLKAAVERHEGRGNLLVTVRSRDGLTLRVLKVRQQGRRVLTKDQVLDLTRQLCPDADSQDLDAWRAVLGDGYILVGEEDPAYHRVSVAGSVSSMRTIPEERFCPPTGRQFIRNDGVVSVLSWEPLALDKDYSRFRTVDASGPHSLTGGYVVTCADGDRSFLLETRAVFAGPFVSRDVLLFSEAVTLLRGETHQVAIDLPVNALLQSSSIGQVYLEVIASGQRVASTPVTDRINCAVK